MDGVGIGAEAAGRAIDEGGGVLSMSDGDHYVDVDLRDGTVLRRYDSTELHGARWALVKAASVVPDASQVDESVPVEILVDYWRVAAALCRGLHELGEGAGMNPTDVDSVLSNLVIELEREYPELGWGNVLTDSWPLRPEVKERFVAKVWCPDCNGQNFQGCFDGQVEVLGPFDTREEADAAGLEMTRGNIWHYDVEPEVKT